MPYQNDTSAGGTLRVVFARLAVSDGLMGLLVAVSLLCLYLAVSRHSYWAYDAQSMAAVTHNLVNHFRITTVGALHDTFHMSTPYSPYGIALSLLLVPFYAISKLTGGAGFWQSLLNPCLMAASAAIVYRIGRALGWSSRLAVLAAFAFGALTMALQSTTELFSEPGVGLCEALMVLAVVSWRNGAPWAPWMLGLSAAAVIQFRSDSILTVWTGLLAIPLFVPWRQLLRSRVFVAVLAPIVVSLALLLWYNAIRFGSVFVTTYDRAGYTTPLHTGLYGLIASPGKGLLIFNPIVIPGVVGLFRMFVTFRPLAVLSALLIVPRVLLFAKWNSWEGGLSYGPRFLMPIVFLFVLAAFDLVRGRMTSRSIGSARVLVAASLVLSVPISFLSARVPYEQWWATLETPALRAQVAGHDSTIVTARPNNIWRRMDFTVDASELHGEFLLLSKGKAQMAPALWREGESWLGWLLLGMCLEGMVVAVMAATEISPDPAVEPLASEPEAAIHV